MLLAVLPATLTAAAAPDTGERALAQALHGAAASLTRRIGADGRFRYRIDASGRDHAGYNVVRHAGALWILQDYHRRHPHPQLARDLDRASRWLEQCCLRELPRWPLTALWSVPEGAPDEAKLGAAGLALAAWNGMAAQGLAHPPAPDMQRLARFIVYLQKPDGGFHSKHRDGQRDDRWVSLYYPGEAALGLLAQYRRDRDPLWLDAAAMALEYLAATRAKSGAYVSDHWALIASAELASLEQHARPSLQVHARAVVALLLPAQTAAGDFGHQLRTAPSATRLEALAAAHQLLPPSDPLRGKISLALMRGSQFLRTLQRQQEPLRGAMPRAAAMSPDRRRDELRIDDTQHALAVWLEECERQKYACTRP